MNSEWLAPVLPDRPKTNEARPSVHTLDLLDHWSQSWQEREIRTFLVLVLVLVVGQLERKTDSPESWVSVRLASC